MENFRDLNLYKDARSILMQTERIKDSIQEIKHKQLQESLLDMLKTCQADLMILLDTVYQVEQCETDSDLNEFLEIYSGYESETVN